MTRVILTSSDPIVNRIYAPEEAVDYFGEEYLQESGTDIPDDLLQRYLENYNEFWSIQEEINQLLKENEQS